MRKILLTSALVLLLPASASAAVRVSTDTVRAGKSTNVTVVPSRAVTCRVTVAGVRGSGKAVSGGSLRFTFKTAKTARSGRYPVSVVCGSEKKTARLTVKGTKRGTRKIVSGKIRSTVMKPGSATPNPTTPTDPFTPTTPGGTGSTTPTVDDESGPTPEEQADAYTRDVAIPRYRNGQCTDWASAKREDLVYQMLYLYYLDVYRNGSTTRQRPERGFMWPQVARDSGLKVSSGLAAGTVIAFQPGVAGAGPDGHLGYVEAVNADGSFVISEMNFAGGPGVMTQRTLGPAIPQGVDFIG